MEMKTINKFIFSHYRFPLLILFMVLTTCINPLLAWQYR